MKDKLKAKQDEVKSSFDKLESQKKQLTDQRAELDRRLSAIASEQVRLQGAYKAYSDLLEEGKDDKKKKDK